MTVSPWDSPRAPRCQPRAAPVAAARQQRRAVAGQGVLFIATSASELYDQSEGDLEMLPPPGRDFAK